MNCLMTKNPPKKPKTLAKASPPWIMIQVAWVSSNNNEIWSSFRNQNVIQWNKLHYADNVTSNLKFAHTIRAFKNNACNESQCGGLRVPKSIRSRSRHATWSFVLVLSSPGKLFMLYKHKSHYRWAFQYFYSRQTTVMKHQLAELEEQESWFLLWEIMLWKNYSNTHDGFFFFIPPPFLQIWSFINSHPIASALPSYNYHTVWLATASQTLRGQE